MNDTDRIEERGEIRMILITNKELDINVPDQLVFTDNGAYDLEKENITGYYTWIGFEHSSNGATNTRLAKTLEKYVYDEVVPTFERLFGTKQVVVDDKRSTTDMFRVWVATYEK